MQARFDVPPGDVVVRSIKRVRPIRHITSSTVIVAIANLTIRGVAVDGFTVTFGPNGLQVNPPLARYISSGRVRYKQVVELSDKDAKVVRLLVLSASHKQFF